MTLEIDLHDLESKVDQNLHDLETKMSYEVHVLTVKVDKFMFLLFGTFTASMTAAVGAILTIAILY